MMVVLIVALVVVVGVVVAVVIGKVGSDSMAEPTRTSAFELPEKELGSADLEQVRFEQSLRGYNMTQVDAVLERLTEQLRRSEDERRAARKAAATPATQQRAGDIVQFRSRRVEPARVDDE